MTTLVDAAPLVSLHHPADPDHDTCLTVLDTLRLPLLTTWPAFLESPRTRRAPPRCSGVAMWRWVARRLGCCRLPVSAVAVGCALEKGVLLGGSDLAFASFTILRLEMAFRASRSGSPAGDRSRDSPRRLALLHFLRPHQLPTYPCPGTVVSWSARVPVLWS